MKTDKHQMGMTFGLVAALFHFLWIVAILVGIAERLMAWAVSIQSLDFPYAIIDPTLVGSVALVIVGFVGGYVIGWLLAGVWGWLGKKR